MNNQSISLIIPSYKNPKCLDLCLRSALENRVYPETEIFVTIDGFPELSQTVMDKYKDKVNFIVYETNTGMQNAINVAVYQSKGNKLFIINDDNVLPREWDKRILNLPNIENVKSLTISQIEPEQSIFNFDCKDFGRDVDEFKYNDFMEYEYNLNINKDPIYIDTGNIFPFIIEREYFMVINGFDTQYPGMHVVDWDFFMKLEINGIYTRMTKSIMLYHFGQMSSAKTDESEMFKHKHNESIEYFEFKWGFKPHINAFTNRHLPPNYNRINDNNNKK